MNKYIHKAKIMTNAELESAVQATVYWVKKNSTPDEYIDYIKDDDYYFALFNEYGKRCENGRIKNTAFNVLR